VARGADKSGLAYNELRVAQRQWHSLRRVVNESKVDGAQEVVRWLDREADELTAIAGQRSRGARAAKATPEVAAVRRAASPRGKRTDRRQIYEAFVAATADATPRVFPSLERLACFLGPDDPVWARIAEAAGRLDVRDAEAMALKIQGLLGEALAVRHPWVVHSLTGAAEQAKKLRKALGSEWRVVFVEGETYASKTAGSGLGQLYDASVWLVRPGKGAAGELAGDAVPIWALEVKSGRVSLAPKQIKSDFVREIGTKETPTIRLPARGGDGKRYRLHNLRKLLAAEGVDPAKAGIGDPSTRRMLVTPREPTDSSLIRGLPKGVAVDYVHALMSGQELRECSQALARRLKRLARK
jgi:hypothetical protein